MIVRRSVLPTSPTFFCGACLACEADFERVPAQNVGLRRTGCPRILARGVFEYWSIGVLRFPGIAPRDREVGGAFKGAHITLDPGRLGKEIFHGMRATATNFAPTERERRPPEKGSTQ